MEILPLLLFSLTLLLTGVVLFLVWRTNTEFQQSKSDLLAQLARLQGILESSAGHHLAQNLQQLQLEQRETATLMGSVIENLAELHQKSDRLQSQFQQDWHHTRDLIQQIKIEQQQQKREEDQAFEAIHRLEAVLAGSAQRGKAGENILAQVLQELPPEWREYNVRFGGKVVEFAIPLPGGKYLPVDSKWTSRTPLERLTHTTDPNERQHLIRQIERDVERKISEIRQYLDPERTYNLGIMAVPDAVYDICGAAQVSAYRQGIIIISYRLALPYLLMLLHLIRRFTTHLDTAQLHTTLRTIANNLEQMENEIEGRFARSITSATNSLNELRTQLSHSRRVIAQLDQLREEET
ncbi:MAG: DNA recombination protein RmuC [Gemmatimonadetes bacterium]|nr:MAG: DNA recombination protein RmuC [Gemmatimonadota bacterium]